MILIPFPLLLIADEDDREFMVGLYERYHSLLYGQALMILHSPAAAEDAVSDCMLALMKKISFLRAIPCNKLKAYVVITVKHQALNQLRRKKREDVTADGEMEERAAPNETDARLIDAAGVERIKHAICALPQREKQVLMMKYFREMSDEEIAAELRLKANSIRVVISRARAHLTELLKMGEEG